MLLSSVKAACEFFQLLPSSEEQPSEPGQAAAVRSRLRWNAAGLVVKIVALGLLVILPLIWLFRFNSSPSRDIGFYYHPPIFSSSVAVGDGVLACPPPLSTRIGLDRGYLAEQSIWDCPPGARPINKEVVAVEGDTVLLSKKGLFVNGERLGGPSPSIDRRGRPMPLQYGTYVLKKNTFWLSADIPCSFDSRYFGPVSRSRLVARAIPVWTAVPDTENLCDR